ncbi:MAG: FadR family transcriptional regulator [Lawsonibacter sp.]|nr:FadR family transcriptional regulator [Lawsonibacter sp.]
MKKYEYFGLQRKPFPKLKEDWNMKEIQRVSITDAVVTALQEMIESGEYKIGEKMPTEAELCSTLKVSRTSVREALRVLQAMEYVEMRPGKGSFVADFRVRNSNWYDVEDAKFYDFMEVRQAIETLSVRLSVERATDQQIQELEGIHLKFKQANLDKDVSGLVRLDEMFHTKIIEYTDNQLLININQQLLESFRKYRNSSFMNSRVYQNAEEPHERILACFQTKNAAQAVREMRCHLDITAKDMEIIHGIAMESD